MQFFYLYKALTHPEFGGYVTPVDLKERLMHIREAKRTLGTQIPWLCDTISNNLKHAIGNAPNSEYLLDPNGRIVTKRGWSDPEALRKDLARLIGPVENPTKVSDLRMNVAPAPALAAKGVVPRVRLTGRFMPLRIEPQLVKSKSPFYVKVRVEADQAFLKAGKGRLYLGFHLDPLYGVYWNNLVAPVRYELHATDGVVVSPSQGEGPKVTAEKDADPREFLLQVSGRDGKTPARLVYKYFACNDKMCNAVTQEYLIRWEVDRDGGSVMRRPDGLPRPNAQPD